MSVTLKTLRDSLRTTIRDAVLPYHVADDEADEAIRAAMVTVSGRVPLGEKWVSAAVTLTSGSDTATLPATVALFMVYALRRHSDGELLEKRDVDELECLFWRGQTAADNGHANPTDYALTEDDGVVTVRFQAPVGDEPSLDLRRSVIPADLSDDTDTVPLSPLLQRAVVDHAGADLVAKLPATELSQMRLDKGYGSTLVARAERAIHDETVRLDGLHSTGRVQRYVK